ncbi:hypothetical protein K501DRAFT_189738, partial [Backusella circina FSU 941]
HVDLSVITSLKNECSNVGDWSPLLERLTTAFGDLNILSTSFLQTGSVNDVYQVDKNQAKASFELLLDSPPVLLSTITEQSRKTLRTLIRNSKESVSNKHLNIIIILFQCSAFTEAQGENNLLDSLCELIVGLTKEQQELVCSYLVLPLDGAKDENSMEVDITANDYASQFKFILNIFHEIIRARLLSRISGGSSFSPNSDPVIMDATKCIAILYGLNEKRKCISYTEFYNDVINEHLEIKEDFPNYKDKKG